MKKIDIIAMCNGIIQNHTTSMSFRRGNDGKYYPAKQCIFCEELLQGHAVDEHQPDCVYFIAQKVYDELTSDKGVTIEN